MYKRQTALFQRSCEQLKDLYHIQEDLEQVKCVEDHQADAGVSEFVLKEPGVWRENSKFNGMLKIIIYLQGIDQLEICL